MTQRKMIFYTVCWILLCFIALAILFKDRQQLRAEWMQYLRFLGMPWKLAIFIPAFLFVTFAGRFTDDETWDVVTGAAMSILTFVTAPWSLALIYQVFKGKRAPRYLLVAIVFCLFSSSWFYDAYLFLRDGHYTVRWLGNLMLSPIMYVAAGLLWNLEAKDRFFAGFAFVRNDWPALPADKSFRPLLPIALALVCLVAGMLTSYVRWHLF